MIVQLALLAMLQQTAPPAAADKSYLFFVAVEGRDEVALLRFDAKGLRVEHRTTIGQLPGDAESPAEVYRVEVTAPAFPALNGQSVLLSSAHGFAPERLSPGPRHLTLSPDGRWYYVTTARGFPNGLLLKVRIAADSSPVPQPSDTVRAQEQLGAAPDEVAISRDGLLAWVTGSGPGHSGVSIIYLSSMIEAGQIATCGGARGSRFTSDGSKHYSLCGTTDMLVEIDAGAMKVNRQLSLGADGQRRCGVSALTMVPDGSRIFVSCNESNDIVEVDGRSWTIRRRVAVGAGPAALAVTAAGDRLIVIDQTGGAISLIDLRVGSGTASGRPTVQVDASYRNAYLQAPGGTRVDRFDLTAIILAAAGFGAPLPALHATPVDVATSSDGRFAFVTASRSATDPGTITVIDLASHQVVASLDFGRRLAGIVFWK